MSQGSNKIKGTHEMNPEFTKRMRKIQARLVEDISRSFSAKAVEAHVFGSIAKGTNDSLSDVDIWITFKDEEIEDVLKNRFSTYSLVGEVVLSHELQNNFPLGGIQTAIIYKVEGDLVRVDYYLCPLSTSRIFPDSMILFKKADVPIGNIIPETKRTARGKEDRITFFISMCFVAIKKIARGEQAFIDFLLEEFKKYQTDFPKLVMPRDLNFVIIKKTLKILEEYSDETQKKAIYEINRFMTKVDSSRVQANFFKEASKYYKYRNRYPDSLIELIKSKLDLNGSGNLLDIGCGIGFLSLPLSKYFERVFAVDIDPGMIEEGKKEAKRKGVPNITWINKNGDELIPSETPNVKVVSFAASLHWFDQEKILKYVNGLLPSDGAVVLVGGSSVWRHAPERWQQKTLEVIKKFLGEERQTTGGTFQKPKYKFGESLKFAGFRHVETQDFDFPTRILSSDDIVNEQFSMSYAAPELFKGRAEDFAKELKFELLKINPHDKFEEDDEGSVVFGWKRL